MSQPVPAPEDREQQAAVTRLLLYYVNDPGLKVPGLHNGHHWR
ncbi:hypothetical protein ACWCQN_33685 [Streptomyces sp. NPDC001984]